MGLPPAHCVVIGGVQILFEPRIGHQMIVIVLKVNLFLHGLIKSVLYGLYYYL